MLPNNKNIILAAEQAAKLEKEKQLIVIGSKTIPQGISAMIGFNPDHDAEDNAEGMRESMSYVKSGQVTYAVRDTVIDGREIKTGDYMGIGDSGIQAVGADITTVCKELVASMKDDESELMSLYYGSDVSDEDAKNLYGKMKEAFPRLEIELHSGGQPVYYYIISVE